MLQKDRRIANIEHMDNRLVGYARVSTDDQTTRQQIDELKAAGCTEIFEDVISGASTGRAGLDACLDTLNQGDALVVVALDRIGRSTAHVIATVETLGKRGLGFKSLREPMFDTTVADRRVSAHNIRRACAARAPDDLAAHEVGLKREDNARREARPAGRVDAIPDP
jgi:hypothetical protein